MSKIDRAIIGAWIGGMSVLIWFIYATLERTDMAACTMTGSYEWIDGDCVRANQ